MKRKLRILYILILAINIFAMPVYAFQSKASNFSKNYSLTGNYANDIVAVAKAQIGKTQSNLGYTEAWCADFVMDCARLTGMSDSVIPYNYSGGCLCPLFARLYA